jgi:hypothetical protein
MSHLFVTFWIIQLHVSLQLIVDLCTQGYLSDKASLQMQIKNTTDVYKDDIPTFNAEHKTHDNAVTHECEQRMSELQR